MKNYFRIISFASPVWLNMSLYSLFTFFGIIFGIANIALLAPVLEVIFNPEDLQDAVRTSYPEFAFSKTYFKDLASYCFGQIIEYCDSKPQNILKLTCLTMFGSIVLSNLSIYVSARFLAKIRSKGIRNLRKALYEKILNLHVGYFSEKNKGDLLSRMTNDIMAVEVSVLYSIQFLVRDPLTIIIIIILLFVYWAKMTLIILFAFIPAGIVIGIITKRLKKTAYHGQHTLGGIMQVIDETLIGIRIIKAFNATMLVLKKFDKENDTYAKLLKKIAYKREMASPLSQIMGAGLVLGVVVYYGGSEVLAGTAPITESTFIVYVLMYTYIISPAKNFSNFFSGIQQGLAAGDRIFEVIDKKISVVDIKNAIKVTSFNERISFKDVSFSYGEERVLNGINLEIEKGKTIAIVGPSGGGKTTLINLLPRLHDIGSGEIIIDGNNIKSIELESLRNLMGLVTQESVLFNDTVYNNISFSKPECTLEEVVEAAKAANAHEFISDLENGYETNVGDRGSKLSGGQKQRITIARALLKNPPILLLDEATSALDSEAEHMVQQALNNLMKNRTSVVIAHRLSTIQNADEIIVIEKGKIEERGTHDELIKNDATYKKFINLQSV